MIGGAGLATVRKTKRLPHSFGFIFFSFPVRERIFPTNFAQAVDLFKFLRGILIFGKNKFVFNFKIIRLYLLMTELDEKSPNRQKILLTCLVLAVGLIYYFSNPKPQHYYDYTFRVAGNMLRGVIAFKEKQPSWLNEFVPFEGFYYSVFPLGSVVTMIPFALFKFLGVISEMPAAFIAALSASVIGLFLFLIAGHYNYRASKRILMVLGYFVRHLDVDESRDGRRVAARARLCDGRRARRDLFHRL